MMKKKKKKPTTSESDFVATAHTEEAETVAYEAANFSLNFAHDACLTGALAPTSNPRHSTWRHPR